MSSFQQSLLPKLAVGQYYELTPRSGGDVSPLPLLVLGYQADRIAFMDLSTPSVHVLAGGFFKGMVAQPLPHERVRNLLALGTDSPVNWEAWATFKRRVNTPKFQRFADFVGPVKKTDYQVSYANPPLVEGHKYTLTLTKEGRKGQPYKTAQKVYYIGTKLSDNGDEQFWFASVHNLLNQINLSQKEMQGVRIQYAQQMHQVENALSQSFGQVVDAQSKLEETDKNDGVPAKAKRSRPSKIDLDGVFDGSTDFYSVEREKLQSDRVEKVYALVDELKGRISNRAALSLLVLARKNTNIRYTLNRALSLETMDDARQFFTEQMAKISRAIDITTTSAHYEIFSFYCDFMKLDINQLMTVPDETFALQGVDAVTVTTAEVVPNATVATPDASELVPAIDVAAQDDHKVEGNAKGAVEDGKVDGNKPLKYFAPNKSGDDMDAPFNDNTKFYQRAREFMQPDKIDATYALLDELKDKISNKAALLLIVISLQSEDRKNNLPRTLKLENKAAVGKYTAEEFARIAESIDVSDQSPHHEIFKYCCEFMGQDYKAIITSANATKASKEVSADSPQAFEQDVQVLMNSVLATFIPPDRFKGVSPHSMGKNLDEYHGYRALLPMAASVLNAEDFSMLAFYMRPPIMYRANDPQKRVRLPANVEMYRKPKNVQERKDASYLAAVMLIISDVYKSSASYSIPVKRKACKLLSGIKDLLAANASANAVAQAIIIEREKKEALKVADGVEIPKEPKVAKVRREKPPTEGKLEGVAPVVAVSVDTAQVFNSVSGVIAEEKAHIQKFSPEEGLLGYFAEVAGLGSKSLALLSMSFLRKEKLKPTEAAQKLGLDFEDAVAMVNGAILKIQAKAQEGGDEFVIDRLQSFNFGA